MNYDNNLNNGISNNQPLQNNQNISNGNMQHGQMNNNIYQQSVQSQDISINNQMNDNQSNYQPSMNNKTPKKGKLGLIIGGISAAVVLGIGVFLFAFLGNGILGNKDTDSISNIKNGSAKLVATSTKRFSVVSDRYFRTEVSYGDYDLLDNNGNKLLTSVTDVSVFDDRYARYEEDDVEKIYDLKKKKIVLEYDYDSYSFLYNDNVFYYSSCPDGKCFLRAYDLLNTKELWKYDINTIGSLKNVIGNYIFVDAGNYQSMTEFGRNNDDIYGSLILDLDGNVVVEGNTDEYEYYDLEKDNLVHTFAMNDKYYLKVKFKKYIEVYDFNHNLVSSISLEPKGDITYHFTDIFDSGLFTVWQRGEGDDYKYILYDVNKKVVLESRSVITLVGNVDDSLILKGSNKSSTKYYLIKDNKVVEEFDDYSNGNASAFGGDGINKVHLLIEHVDRDNWIFTNEFINLTTLEKHELPLEKISDSYGESPNAKYLILSTGNDFYVYDSKFNLKYESTNHLEPINDEYVLEYTLDNNGKMHVVNINSGVKKEIDVKGKYNYIINTSGFVTTDGTNYYLYAFN